MIWSLQQEGHKERADLHKEIKGMGEKEACSVIETSSERGVKKRARNKESKERFS